MTGVQTCALPICFPVTIQKSVAGDCSKRDIMTNLHKEPEHVQQEILRKASLVMPLYNKGGLQYAGPDVDLTTVGSKSRRG